jgi:four helix bundle suffix protein
MTEPLIPKHGGYRRLISFQVAQLAFDVTVRFCDRYIDRKSRTRDQMVQAARSGVQNIAEGSQASGTSKKMELKLTNVARASLEELKLDYEDFLRQRGLPQWEPQDPRRAELIRRRPKNLEAVARWIQDLRTSTSSISSTSSTISSQEAAANGALALLAVATALLDRQVAALARAFETEGGFTERLYRTRVTRRTGSSAPHFPTLPPPAG